MATIAKTSSAANRWKILRNAILSAQSSDQSDNVTLVPPTGSVRSFSSFGLFNTSPCENGWTRYSPVQPVSCLGAHKDSDNMLALVYVCMIQYSGISE